MNLNIKRFGAFFMSLMVLSPGGGYVHTAAAGTIAQSNGFFAQKSSANDMSGRNKLKKQAVVGGGIGIGSLIILACCIASAVHGGNKRSKEVTLDDNPSGNGDRPQSASVCDSHLESVLSNSQELPHEEKHENGLEDDGDISMEPISPQNIVDLNILAQEEDSSQLSEHTEEAEKENLVPKNVRVPQAPIVQLSARFDSRSPSPMMDDLKLNDELTVEFSSLVTEEIRKFCRKSRPYNSLRISREKIESDVQKLIEFLAKIENTSYNPENLTSLIESNATRCWQNLHFSVSHNRKVKNSMVAEFKGLCEKCSFEQTVGRNSSDLNSIDWKMFRETLLRKFVVVSDIANKNKKTVRLKTEKSY